jgi:hypothetical protein
VIQVRTEMGTAPCQSEGATPTLDLSDHVPSRISSSSPLVIKNSGGIASPHCSDDSPIRESELDASALDAFNREFSGKTSVRLCALTRTELAKFRTCDSPLRCVWCSTHRLEERRQGLKAGMRSAPHAAMVSLTRRHGAGPLGDEWNATQAVVRRFSDNGSWSRFQKQHGVDGYSVSYETPISNLGWNVHIHLLMTFSRPLTTRAEECFRKAVTARWCNAAARSGHIAEADRQDVDYFRSKAAREAGVVYVTKQNLRRLAPDTKKGRYPADLLVAAAAGGGSGPDALLYAEYLDAAFGRTQIRSYGRLSTAHIRTRK